MHICLTSNPCQNGATCNFSTNSNTNYTCSCLANFTGQDFKSEHKMLFNISYSVFFQYAIFLVQWLGTNRSQPALAYVFQCISVSPAIPVRMEQHVISVLATLATPAQAYLHSLKKIAVSIKLTLYNYFTQYFSYKRESLLTKPMSKWW